MDKEILKEMRKAIKSNDLEHIKELIDNNQGILEEVTPCGTFLQDAATFGLFDVARYLIERGIDINKTGGAGDVSALTDAAFEGDLDMVKLLYDNGAIFDVSTFARNPLIAAIYNDHFDVVKFLVEKGIDLTPCYGIGDYDNVNAYDYAKLYGRTEIADYLKEKM
ncbi:ankyrin repeat domain-containing protein [Butyrivibrio sp. X503]|uniref:ankyrin repeat domain-containing protein n=1 Tax=Butyrivibrio sp. X503 TaxID=2364878 RepID=UPI000EA84662|nr:ankyrin repeat domain-containing protein [Butyrivibrio sp. X503]RKM55661.1 ankyrin repeat domain-containing protein [Butyrivibrio sp. X503]